jgi:hypothetical protein
MEDTFFMTQPIRRAYPSVLPSSIHFQVVERIAILGKACPAQNTSYPGGTSVLQSRQRLLASASSRPHVAPFTQRIIQLNTDSCYQVAIKSTGNFLFQIHSGPTELLIHHGFPGLRSRHVSTIKLYRHVHYYIYAA